MKAKIINEITKEVSIALGNNPPNDYIEMEVEKAYNGNWYLKGHAPTKPQSVVNAERVIELKQLLAQKDYIGVKIATGCATKEDYAKEIAMCEEWRQEIRDLINENTTTDFVDGV